MSSLVATVSKIQNCDSLHVVQFTCKNKELSMMSLDIDKSIKIGLKVTLSIKPSHVAIGKAFNGEISYSNILPSTIISIENGELLTAIVLDFFGSKIESIITLNSSKKMGLKVGDEVMAFVKASEISIGEILDV